MNAMMKRITPMRVRMASKKIHINVSSKDPTQTLTIRKRAVAEINGRFNRIKGVIRETIIDNRALHTNVSAADSGRFAFLRDADKVGEFRKWLDEQINQEILTGSARPADHWLNRYISTSYTRGAKKTQNILKKFYPDLPDPTISVFSNPAHTKRAELIYTRAFSDLQGVTDTMATQMSGVLSDGIVQGRGIKQIARDLNNRVDKIGKVRSRLLARTEVVEAHNSASIVEAGILEDEIGEEVKMRWITSLDGRERASHRARHRKIFTRKRAQQLIGEPNCRCSISAWTKDFEEIAKEITSKTRTTADTVLENNINSIIDDLITQNPNYLDDSLKSKIAVGSQLGTRLKALGHKNLSKAQVKRIQNTRLKRLRGDNPPKSTNIISKKTADKINPSKNNQPIKVADDIDDLFTNFDGDDVDEFISTDQQVSRFAKGEAVEIIDNSFIDDSTIPDFAITQDLDLIFNWFIDKGKEGQLLKILLNKNPKTFGLKSFPSRFKNMSVNELLAISQEVKDAILVYDGASASTLVAGNKLISKLPPIGNYHKRLWAKFDELGWKYEKNIVGSANVPIENLRVNIPSYLNVIADELDSFVDSREISNSVIQGFWDDLPKVAVGKRVGKPPSLTTVFGDDVIREIEKAGKIVHKPKEGISYIYNNDGIRHTAQWSEYLSKGQVTVPEVIKKQTVQLQEVFEKLPPIYKPTAARVKFQLHKEKGAWYDWLDVRLGINADPTNHYGSKVTIAHELTHAIDHRLGSLNHISMRGAGNTKSLNWLKFEGAEALSEQAKKATDEFFRRNGKGLTATNRYSGDTGLFAKGDWHNYYEAFMYNPESKNISFEYISVNSEQMLGDWLNGEYKGLDWYLKNTPKGQRGAEITKLIDMLIRFK